MLPGQSETLPRLDPETVVDVGGRLVTPGFVDAHTHLVFGGWRHEEYAMRSAGKSYLEIAQAGGGIVSISKDSSGFRMSFETLDAVPRPDAG